MSATRHGDRRPLQALSTQTCRTIAAIEQRRVVLQWRRVAAGVNDATGLGESELRGFVLSVDLEPATSALPCGDLALALALVGA